MFKIKGLTWIIQRSFAWLGRNRRLSKDYEYRVRTSETMIDVAAIRFMLNRHRQLGPESACRDGLGRIAGGDDNARLALLYRLSLPNRGGDAWDSL